MTNRPLPRPRLPIVALVTTTIATLTVALVAAGWSGALTPTVLLDPGVLTRIGLPAITAASHLALGATAGALLLAAGLLGGRTTQRRALIIAVGAAITWSLLAIARLILTASATMGVPVTDAAFGPSIEAFVTQLEGGRMLAAIPIVAAIVACVALAASTPTGAAWGLVLTVAAMGMQATIGHSAAEGGHHLALTAMFLHLLGAAAWIGPLLALAALSATRGMPQDEFSVALHRYSAVALWSCILVGVSGIASAVVRVGGIDGLSSRYGALLVGKAALFAALVACGVAHRRFVLASLPATRGSARLPATIGGATKRAFWRLASVELVIMGAVTGVAVALGRTAPPAAQPPAITAAYLVTGRQLPPAPTLANYLTQWAPDVLFGFLAAAGLVAYLRWAIRLRARGDAWPVGRTVSWCAAMLVFGWVTSGGPAVYGHVLFSAHMFQHMLLAMVIPLFVTAAAPMTLALRALPARYDGSRGPREWLLTVLHSRWGQFFSHPIVAAVNFAGSMVLFYYTPAFEFALRTSLGHALMVVHFSLAGYLFANALVGIDPGTNRPSYPLRIVLLLATMAFHAFFGVAMMSSEQLLVASWFGWLGREWGPSALEDQHSGGEIAWGIGEVPTLLLAVIVALRWAKSDQRDARRRDRQADRTGDAEMVEYNEMLARLAERDRRE